MFYNSNTNLQLNSVNFTALAELENSVRRAVLSKSRTQQMVDRLRELQASSPDIEASAIVSVDGLSIASALPHGVEEDRVSAMSAAMLSLGERIASELGRGIAGAGLHQRRKRLCCTDVGRAGGCAHRAGARTGQTWLDLPGYAPRRGRPGETDLVEIVMAPIQKSGLAYPNKFGLILVQVPRRSDGTQWPECHSQPGRLEPLY